MAKRNSKKAAKQTLRKEILVSLGNNLIEVEDHLTPEDLDTCIKFAIEQYRQRADNALEESIAFLVMDEEQQDYFLPEDVVEVRKIFRRGLSTAATTSGSGVGSEYDPFDLAFTNIYLLQAGGQDGLLTFELYNQYLETAGRLFGSEFNFTWDRRSKRLRIVRYQRVREEALLWIYREVPEEDLICDQYGSGPWIRSYATAWAKMILGQAYETFSQIPGPGGGVTLNGSQLKAEAQAEMEMLEEKLKRFADRSDPLGFIIG